MRADVAEDRKKVRELVEAEKEAKKRKREEQLARSSALVAVRATGRLRPGHGLIPHTGLTLVTAVHDISYLILLSHWSLLCMVSYLILASH
jgi:hypothetical protein